MQLDARSRRSSRGEQLSLTPRGAADAAAAGDLSLSDLDAGVADLEGQAARFAQRSGAGTQQALDEMDQMSANILEAMNGVKVSAAEARRRAGAPASSSSSSGAAPGGSAGGGGAKPAPMSAARLEAAARSMVDLWLERRGLVQYAERIVHAFQEALYKPHEWTHTLESMGDDELKEFIAAVEKSPAPNESGLEDAPQAAAAPAAAEPRPSRRALRTPPDGLAGTLAEVSRLSQPGPPKAGRRASSSGGGGVKPSSRDGAGPDGSGRVGRRTPTSGAPRMEAVPRAAVSGPGGGGRGAGGRGRGGSGPHATAGAGAGAAAPVGARAGRRAAQEAEAAARLERGRRAAAMMQ